MSSENVFPKVFFIPDINLPICSQSVEIIQTIQKRQTLSNLFFDVFKIRRDGIPPFDFWPLVFFSVDL